MKEYFRKAFCRQSLLLIFFALAISWFTSCTDIYQLDNTEPAWLGGSIYDYLNKDGHYSNFVHLIKDLKYDEVLSRTGSVTLFVSNDSAFNEFYKKNDWGVSVYDQLTVAQKKLLLNYSIINNTFTSDMYSNYNSGGILNEGTAMRRQTTLENIDSICFEKPEFIPSNNYWNYYKTTGINLIKDMSISTTTATAVKTVPMAFITQPFMDKYGITNEDFSYLANGAARTTGDWYVFDNKVVKKDIRCKNGYIHLLDKVLVPHANMAEYINKCADTKIFSSLIERFSAPKYDAANTMAYKLLHLEFADSIFSKTYFASIGGETKDKNSVNQVNLLPFNPGWNSYKASSGVLQADMAAMFVPTDKAMMDYLNGNGVGAILKERFGSWENMPTNIVLPFLKRHMRTSMIESVPSKFSKMVDGENYPMPVQKSHIDVSKSYLGVNGEVFVTNTVYPPVDYISVYSPVLMSSNTKIIGLGN